MPDIERTRPPDHGPTLPLPPATTPSPRSRGNSPWERTEEPDVAGARPHNGVKVKLAPGSAFGVALAGGAALVLGIVGLLGILPRVFAELALICCGVAMFLHGSSIAARYRSLIEHVRSGTTARGTIATSLSVESIGGLGGAALGALALLGVLPLTMLAAGALVIGGTVLLSSGSTQRLNELTLALHGLGDDEPDVGRGALDAAATLSVLAGGGAVVLGILALLGISPLTMVLVSLVALGGAALVAGSAVGGKLAAVAEHEQRGQQH